MEHSEKHYTCPMHPEVVSDKPGLCSKCGMELVGSGGLTDNHPRHTSNWRQSLITYRPLIIILTLIFLTSLAAALRLSHSGVIHMFMTLFMAGFFIVFGGLKLIDLPGFARSFSNYDLLASHWKPYAFIYPFIELALGFSYLVQYAQTLTSAVALVVLLVATAGVWNGIRRPKGFVCACLGSTFQLPLGKVALAENLLMAAMAAYMLVV